MAVGVLTFKVGRLLCGTVRDFLEEIKFRGHSISWIESSGWFERQFVVRGDYEILERISAQIANWAREVNRE